MATRKMKPVSSSLPSTSKGKGALPGKKAPVEFVAAAADSGVRPDRALRAHAAWLDRDTALAALKAGSITVNGKAGTLKSVLAAGDVVKAHVRTRRAAAPSAKVRAPGEALLARHGVTLLLLDAHLCVVDKPAGMATHRAPGVEDQATLVETVAAFLEQAGHTPQRPPAAAGRLDRGTSGIVLVTLSTAAEKGMARQFEQGAVHKEYLALARGVTQPQFTVEDPVPVARYTGQGSATTRLKEARTDFERVAAGAQATLLRVRPQTGRMHQIRRHLRAVGHPIVGDGRYGAREDRGSHVFCLHCQKVAFAHPVDGRPMEFSAALPKGFAAELARFSVPG